MAAIHSRRRPANIFLLPLPLRLWTKMVQHLLPTCLLVQLLLLPLASARSASSRFNADVGRFHIPISDNRLADPNANHTLSTKLDSLFRDTLNYYYSFDSNQPVAIEAPAVDRLARKHLSPGGFDAAATRLHDAANSTVQARFKDALARVKPPGNVTAATAYARDNDDDFAGYYLDAINNMTISIFYYKLGAYMGVGKTVGCSDFVNEVLSQKDEWAKAGSSAATTLMALVPTFLAFGNLYVPRSSEAFATSPLVGLGCALYSLGLPVRSLSALKRQQVKTLASLSFATLATIASFATIGGRGRPEGRLTDADASSSDSDDDTFISSSSSSSPSSTHPPPTLSHLQSWTRSTPTGRAEEDEARHIFASIKSSTRDWRSRYHWWNTPVYVVVTLQIVMFVMAVAPLLVNVGAPRFLLSCETNWTGRYLGISAGANAILRWLMWQTGHHEQVKIYALSPSAKRSLRHLIYTTHAGHLPSMATEVPPLYPPLLTRIRLFIHPFYPGLFIRLGLMRETRCTYEAHISRSSTKLTQARHALHRNVHMLSWAARNWHSLLQGGFAKRAPAAARRWRPLIVLMHLSSEGRNFGMTLATGFLEAALLVTLTFFFAAQWGGNLVITAVAMALLLVFITLGRALGFFYVYLSSRLWGLHVVDCSSVEEILGALRIVCSMRDVLVCVNGAEYFDGYRLGGMGLEWEVWKGEYVRGVWDGDEDDGDDDRDGQRREKRSRHGHGEGQEVGVAVAVAVAVAAAVAEEDASTRSPRPSTGRSPGQRSDKQRPRQHSIPHEKSTTSTCAAAVEEQV